MKSLKVAIVFLLIESLSISTVFEALGQQELPQEAGAGKVIVISEKVGETIDEKERDRYCLFPASHNFQSAMILQLPDGGYVAEISEEYRGAKKIRRLPLDQATLHGIRDRIDNFGKISSAEKAEIRARYEKVRGAITASSEWKEGQVIILSPKVGETIDLEERNYYGIFLGSLNFHSAVVLQLPDSSYVAEITEEQDGGKKVRTMPIDQQTLDQLREHINTAIGPAPVVKGRFSARPKDLKTIIQQQAAVKEAKGQAQKLVKEKWTKERWREEGSYDRGLSYRVSGAVLGFTLGAAAGMLIGRGFQGREVREVINERTSWEGGGWGEPSYEVTKFQTEYSYSYKNKDAPIYSAAIGGISGGIVGYYLSKKLDKKYYILVPRDIRMQKTKSMSFSTGCLGFGLLGPIMGGLAGYTLYAPTLYKSEWKKGKESGEEKRFGWSQFWGGYFAGSILGTIIVAGYSGRAQHKSLWEASLLRAKPESSLDIQFVPLDRYALSLQPIKSPSGETFYEYRLDLVRMRF